MSDRSDALSPASVGSSEWSSTTRYRASDRTYSPTLNSTLSRNNLITPPTSTSGLSLDGSSSIGMIRRPNINIGNPSPPSSVARSSNGTTLSVETEKKAEDDLAQHYFVLKRYLSRSLRDEKGNPKPTRARDKLLKLSKPQFLELSTDVYDELVRRQDDAEIARQQSVAGQQSERVEESIKPPEIPKGLPPKKEFHVKRNQARYKLSQLPSQRFRDLATDVFYELERRFPQFCGGDIDRRASPANSTRGPPSRTGTPNGIRSESQGQGPRRQHNPRQGSLGGQVFAGLGIPGIGAQDNQYGRPTAKSSQSNTIIPNKSTLVEDDDDQTGPEDNSDIYGLGLSSRRNTISTSANNDRDRKILLDNQTQIRELQGKVSSLEEVVREKDLALEEMHSSRQNTENTDSAQRSQWTALQVDLEGKLTTAMDLNKNLKLELEKVRADHTKKESILQNQIGTLSKQNTGGDEWKMRYDDLLQDHRELKRALQDQQGVTDEVRQEASAFFNEMKAISERSNQQCEQQEERMEHIHNLENETTEWKSRYAQIKAQLRTIRTGSVGLSSVLPKASRLAKNGDFTRPDGLVKDIHVTRFQIAIDEVLQLARGDEPRSVLGGMKMVVVAIRHILRDVNDPKIKVSSGQDQVQQRIKLRTKVSATANNFITASKNFALSHGISPVSLLDAAASHLTSAVVEIVRVVKVRPASGDESDNDDDESLSTSSPGYFSVSNGGGPSIAESLYSPLNSAHHFPPTSNGQSKISGNARVSPSLDGTPNGKLVASGLKIGFGTRTSDPAVDELKLFLEDQTEGLLQSIQSLVSGIRIVDEPQNIRDQIDSIIQIVGRVVKESQRVIDVTGNTMLRDQIESSVMTLAGCRARLSVANDDGEGIQEHLAWKEFTNTLPPLAFEIARETKELVQGVDRVLDDGRAEDDFRF